jgi:pSer/pThr/pTyr-binding forkhead associated (FHA) protein
MLLYLVPIDEGPAILVEGTVLVVGRHPRCDSQLASLRVSRQHCCITSSDGEVRVRDLGSTNGTWINGRRVDHAVLRPGDVLSIAHLRYRMDTRCVE